MKLEPSDRSKRSEDPAEQRQETSGGEDGKKSVSDLSKYLNNLLFRPEFFLLVDLRTLLL